MDLDTAVEAANDGKAQADAVTQAREKVKSARDKVAAERANYTAVTLEAGHAAADPA